MMDYTKHFERLLAEKERDVSLLARDVVDYQAKIAKLDAMVGGLQRERNDLEAQLNAALATVKRVRDREATVVQALAGQVSWLPLNVLPSCRMAERTT